jgi:hypothetical protein
MVVKRGNKELRSFAVSDVQNVDGCVSKFRAGRYTNRAPSGAAGRAFTRLCNLKNIRGKCTFIVTVKDTTQGHKCRGKEYTYKLERTKLKKPVIRFEGTDKEYKIEFKTTMKKAKQIVKCDKNRERTVGRMKQTSRRANKRRMAEKKARMSMRKRKVSGKKNNVNNNNNNNNNRNNNNRNNNNRNNNMNGGSRKSRNARRGKKARSKRRN